MHDFWQVRSERCGLGMSDECRPSVLQGDGGDAVGAAHTPLPLRGTPPMIRGSVVGFVPPEVFMPCSMLRHGRHRFCG